MVRKGKEFNEIFDLTALRVLVDSVKDCYAALGIIHSLWKPLPGRFKDYIAMPKFNMYQSLHTTVIGPQGKPLEIQIRTYDMHETAQFGIAAHWMYKEKRPTAAQRADAQTEKFQWLRQIMDWQSETKDPGEFMESLRIDLFHDEVYVFTPKGEVKSLPAGSTPVDFAYAIHTDVGHRCVGAKVDGRIVPLTYKLQSGDIVEILTSKTAQGPSRDWLQFVQSSGARNKIRQWFKKERREDAEHLGSEALLDAVPQAGPAGPAPHRLRPARRGDEGDELTRRRRTSSSAVGSGKISPQHVVTRVIQMLNPGERPTADFRCRPPSPRRRPRSRVRETAGHPRRRASTTWPSACRSAAVRCPGDDVVGYISLGAGITVHRRDCPNVRALEKNPERFAAVHWDSDSGRPRFGSRSRSRPTTATICSRTSRARSARAASTSSRRECRVRPRTTWSRTGSCSRCRRSSYLETVLQRIRRIDTVYDAYRVTPH